MGSKSKEFNENHEKHEFAFFLENLSEIIKPVTLEQNKNTEIKIVDQNLLHRLLHIVRLEPGEDFVIFDQKKNAKLQLANPESKFGDKLKNKRDKNLEKKKALTCKIISINENKILKPKINLLVPILKRENFESALYSAVELGANQVTTLITEKSQKTFNHERATKILIAAAEQSKNFAFANLNAPISLTEYISAKSICSNKTGDPVNNSQVNYSRVNYSRVNYSRVNIFFDAEGEELHEVIKNIKESLHENINLNVSLMVGPEGDLTENEKNLLKSHEFIFCKLTPTILRSFQAVNVGLGAFRALLI